MSQEELVVERARRSFQTGRSKPLEFRLQQLRRLQSFLKERQEDIKDALQKDLGKSGCASELYELLVVEAELQLSLTRLAEWAAPRPVEKNLFTLSDEVYVRPEPLGVVLIVGPWNYPWSLTLLPLVGAIAAGNAAIVKPSEISSTSSTVIKQLLPLYLDKDLYQVVEGGVPETQQLLKQRFDHIFYTGSTAVGKLVMEAAAPHLTPVTLELGGKSPCYIDKDCDIRIACRRITWAKLINCGQTCIAPDFILCEPSVQNRVVEEIRRCVKEFYADSPKTSDDYGRIINQRQFKRIVGLMEGCTIAFGGDADESQGYIGPTVLKNVTGDSRVMQEEIFGPLLPIVTVQSVDEAIHFINEREKPLALYVFSHNVKLIEKVLAETSSGALVANDCIVHFLDSALPFGGVGHSGMGRYRGRHTFDQLSNLRSCMIKQLKMEGLNSMRYPPHSTKKLGWARRFLLSQLNVQKLRNMAMLAMLTCLAAFVVQSANQCWHHRRIIYWKLVHEACPAYCLVPKAIILLRIISSKAASFTQTTALSLRDNVFLSRKPAHTSTLLLITQHASLPLVEGLLCSAVPALKLSSRCRSSAAGVQSGPSLYWSKHFIFVLM
ncbi:fatty aldehyde dehydrogenase-like isoform X1 [Xiphophorus couchianus]|uniref:fatty aldehyde dehydrogenase-like isoform X1 n=1 Tax=Xiphophorus couchianus TaxID=32473 RepID=UPI0010165A97|nr:fatty aldehyde dehydrogenase-like isoform X1 [Xiphophorus couchianus]XP_027855174.1 fatty aldehyde dehydrogenase-like isoform X1 [Xiphophorus couchianus]